MSDKDIIQRAYESQLAAVYAAFAEAFTAALGDTQKEAEAEGRFRKGVLHARHLRDQALTILP